MVRMARGTDLSGSFASPAVTATISVPMKLKMTNASASQTPSQPFGRKPPLHAEVLQPDRPLLMDAEQNGRAQQDEHHDGAHLDHGEPILECCRRRRRCARSRRSAPPNRRRPTPTPACWETTTGCRWPRPRLLRRWRWIAPPSRYSAPRSPPRARDTARHRRRTSRRWDERPPSPRGSTSAAAQCRSEDVAEDDARAGSADRPARCPETIPCRSRRRWRSCSAGVR